MASRQDAPDDGSLDGVARAVAVVGWRSGKAADAIRNVDTVITGHTDVKTWRDFVDDGEFNRLFLQHARAWLKVGRSAELGDGHAPAARQVQELHVQRPPLAVLAAGYTGSVT